MLHTFIDIILHLDQHLAEWSAALGPALYAVLFLIVFCETGLVVTPFLPGDSLLFAVGALCALPGSGLDIFMISGLLVVAAIAGDSLNYKIGSVFGERALAGQFRFISQRHLQRTQEFFVRYGRRAVVFARFAPIFRTFAPFVAGLARMPYPRFLFSNVLGGTIWVIGFCAAGYFFGNLPAVKSRFHIVILAIIVVSILPAVIEGIRARASSRSSAV
jgi:membrane-associated protein